MNKKGFTLVELLTAIITTGVLVASAIPMYEKAIEKSRMAEARTVLAKLLDAKFRIMDAWEISDFPTNGTIGAQNLDVSLPCVNATTGAAIACSGTTFYTKAFKYTLIPTGQLSSIPSGVSLTANKGINASVQNAVCAVRRGGPNQGTAFLYVGALTNTTDSRLMCHGDKCGNYGMTNVGAAWCSL